MSLLLIKPQFDIWEPGEHTGTFRGNNLAFVTANEALLQYWSNDKLSSRVKELSLILEEDLMQIAQKNKYDLRGIGFIYGIDVFSAELAAQIRKKAFENLLLVETCGANRSLIKIIPPLTIDIKELKRGIEILKNSFGN